MEEIKQELLELGFDVDSIGIKYWADAIKYIKENPEKWDTCDIYDRVAKENNTRYFNVERAMRHSITPARENIQTKYGYYKKIKNSTFLNLIRFKLI